MKGNMMRMVAATMVVLWMIDPTGPPLSPELPVPVEDDRQASLRYETISFYINTATKLTYTRFLMNIIDSLGIEENRHGVRVLQNGTIPVNRRFVLARLITGRADIFVTVAIDVTDLYIFAYRVGNGDSYFFSDAPSVATDNLFPGTTRHTLGVGSGYPALAGVSVRRSEIYLGILQLQDAVFQLFTAGAGNLRAIGHSIPVILQMVSEAIRFRYIEQWVRRLITPPDYGSSLPMETVLRLENRWGRLSPHIFDAPQGGDFGGRVIDLLRPDGSTFNVRGVTRELVAIIAIIKYGGCWRPPLLRETDELSPLLTRSVVESNDDEEFCGDPQPVRIAGRDGKCAEVSNRDYRDGDPVVMSHCKSDGDLVQLWNLNTDGTIQSSNNKCLTASLFKPGSNIIIYNCNSATVRAAKWEIWDNGTIINPQSGLVLAAHEDAVGSNLTLQVNTYSMSQGWTTGTDVKPFFTSIAGYNDLCLQMRNLLLTLGPCWGAEGWMMEQRWAIYPDGSIRPDRHRSRCLTYEGGVLRFDSCTLVSAGQRWLLEGDGIIGNLESGEVLDAEYEMTENHTVVVAPYDRTDLQQMWFVVF